MANPYTIEDIVNVVINLAARPISQAGFEVPMILGAHNLYTDRIRTYTSIDSIVSDGFASGSAVHQIATLIFSGNNAPSTIKVGRRVLTNYTVTVDTDVAEGDVVSVNIVVDGTSYVASYTLGAAETNVDAATALVADIEGSAIAASVVATDGLDGTFTVAPTASEALSVGVGSNATVVAGASENTDTALAAITAVDDDWFFLLSGTRVDQDVLDLAAYAEANKKLYVTATDNADVITSSTTDILSQLNALQYDNTFVLVSHTADTGFGEGAIVGSVATITPGTSTLHGKTLPGVTVTNYSRTEADFATGKKGNIYPSIAGVGFLLDGFMVSGNFFDVIRGKLYLEARLEEDIFSLIKQKADLGQKIPYTDEGVEMVAGKMRKRLAISVGEGFLAANPAPQVFAPFVADIADTDKANRLLPDIPFEATLAGAVHRVTIKGYVTV